MHTEQVPILYQSINYTEEVRQCIQKRYIYILIGQLHGGGETVYTEEVHVYIYISVDQLHKGGKTMYAEEVPYTVLPPRSN
jgi:hypothetical protein